MTYGRRHPYLYPPAFDLPPGRGSCGEGDVVGVAAIELVEIALVIEDVALRQVLRWGSAEVARRFATAVVAAVG